MSENPKLPNAGEGVVDSAKLTEYLLSTTHAKGKEKAKFFEAFGYSVSNFEQAKTALLGHGKTQPVIKVTETAYGVKYVLECSITTPDGRNPCINTVWIVETGTTEPRLVTAYPN